MNDFNFETWTAMRKRNDRIRAILVGHIMFYILIFMVTTVSGLAGVEIDTYLAVDLIFRVFPLGTVASMALYGAFNTYAYVVE